MYDQDVRQHLQFLPIGGASSSSSVSLAVAVPGAPSIPANIAKQLKKMEGKLKHAEQQLAGAKRKLEQATGGADTSYKGKKGGGKGKKGKGNVPKMGGFPGVLDDGTRICFPFNSASGCSGGPSCWKGSHICLRCKETTHGLHTCTRG